MADVTVYGTLWCSDCKRAKQLLGEQRVAYDFVDVDTDAEGLAVVHRVNDGKSIIPVVVLADGQTLVEPSNAELAAALGVTTDARSAFYDLVVVGSGPAGLTAALYAAREGISTLVIERGGVGGQAGITERLDNFPGFPEGVTGDEFADRLRRQAERFGVEVLAASEVSRVLAGDEGRGVELASGQRIGATAVLLALGSTYRRLGVPGEEDFIGAGVHFCATCDGAFYRDKRILVVGGGNSAGEEGVFLTRFSSDVTIATNGPQLSASAVVREKIDETPAITVRHNTSVTEFKGDGKLASVVFDTGGAVTEEAFDGVFVFVGLSPNTALVDGVVDLDERGFVTTDDGLMTSAPGVFSAGDVRAGSTKQAASAAGEGAAVALGIRRWVEAHGTGTSPRTAEMADATT